MPLTIRYCIEVSLLIEIQIDTTHGSCGMMEEKGDLLQVKKEISAKPKKITEHWPGELAMFSWMDFVAAIPTPLFVVTGWKSNGKENACLQSWATFGSDAGQFVCILSNALKTGHMYQSLKETGCCVLNFPAADIYSKCHKTIDNNQFETDEITASGLTAENAVRVNAPRIAECFLNIECEFLWEQSNFENSNNAVIGLKAVHISMDSDRYDHDVLGRYGKNGYIYNINSPRNPDTGEAVKDSIGIIKINK